MLDFYCAEAMLAVEFDGEQHDPGQDARRDSWLQARGIMTLRIPNREFFWIDQPTHDWVQEIVRLCELRAGRKAFPLPGPPPPQLGEGGQK